MSDYLDSLPKKLGASAPVALSRRDLARDWMRRHRVEALLFLLLWTTYSYFYQSTQHNEAARLDQTRAIVQDHTLLINKYWWNSADVIHYKKEGSEQDHIYPAKAPGMSFIAIPFYAFFLGVLKLGLVLGLPDYVYWHLVTYFTVVTTVSLLSALAAVATYRVLERATNDSYFSVMVILALWLGTLAFPFSTIFFSHQLTAALLALAFYLLFQLRSREVEPTRRTGAMVGGAGFLMGFSVTTEYPVAILVAVFSIYFLWVAARWKLSPRQRAKILAWWILGGLLGGGILVGYNLAAFGKPFYVAYEALAVPGSPFPTHTHGWVGFQLPNWSQFRHAVGAFMLLPPVGLLYVMVDGWRVYACNPVLWFALPGLGVMVWKKEWRAEGLLIAAMTGAYLLFIASYGTSIYDWAGATYLGPRHIIPLLPFFALPLYFGARFLRVFFYPLFAISVFYMLLATAIEPRVPTPFEIPARDFLLPDYLRGKFAENTFNMFDGQNRNLTKDSTAFNLPKLARVPGRYQLAPLMLWWLLAGGALFLAAAAKEAGAERLPRSSPKLAAVSLFLFVSGIALAPIVHDAATSSRDTGHGLLGKYYRNINWLGEPVDVQVDPCVNFDWSKSWPLPAPFSVEWTGKIRIDPGGDYVFSLVADDGAILEIDQQVVVDVIQGPLLLEKNGGIRLSAGLHSIRVRYLNKLFGGSVKLSWSLTGRPKEIVPSAVLVPEERPGAAGR
jgi:hypothetical protein